ncbi:MAG: hypothetical protein ACPG5P_01345 [Saprospiraceae bacterium]
MSLCLFMIIAMSSCKEDLNYYLIVKDSSDMEILNRTIPVSLNSTFSGTLEVQAFSGSKPRIFKKINAGERIDITDSEETGLESEHFSEVYHQKRNLNFVMSDTEYSTGDLLEIIIYTNLGSGGSEESFFLEIE